MEYDRGQRNALGRLSEGRADTGVVCNWSSDLSGLGESSPLIFFRRLQILSCPRNDVPARFRLLPMHIHKTVRGVEASR